MLEREQRHAFKTLDCLRGVAAIAVMMYHNAPFFGRQVFPHGYIAVDFFFMLSGFVLTRAYQDRLDGGWSTGSFLKVRAIRLYPLYGLGLLLGLLFYALQHAHAAGSRSSLAGVLMLAGSSIFMIPAMTNVPGFLPFLFPFNFPSWSLFLEVLVNALHAALMRARPWTVWLAVVLLSGIALLWSAIAVGSLGYGANRQHLQYGVIRVVFSYGFGSLLYRLWKRGFALPTVPAGLVIVMLVASLVGPVSLHLRPMYDFLTVCCFYPVVILLGASSKVGARAVVSFELLGASSYAVYMLHTPFGQFFEQVWNRLCATKADLSAPWSGLTYVVLCLAFSLLVDRFYDGPVRAGLRRKLG